MDFSLAKSRCASISDAATSETHRNSPCPFPACLLAYLLWITRPQAICGLQEPTLLPGPCTTQKEGYSTSRNSVKNLSLGRKKKNWKKKNLPREKASGLVAWWIAQFFKLSLHIFHCKSVRSETCIPGSKRPEPQSETLFTRYQKSIVSAYHRHIPSHFRVRHCLPYKTD